VVAIIALLQVVMSSSFAHTGAKLQTLEAQRSDLQAQIYDLEAEVAALASLERTERMARERLGMIPAKNLSYLSVEVEAPSGPLLPRPLLDLDAPDQSDPAPWWRTILDQLPEP
jgi:cell division protein FtsL